LAILTVIDDDVAKMDVISEVESSRHGLNAGQVTRHPLSFGVSLSAKLIRGSDQFEICNSSTVKNSVSSGAITGGDPLRP
jgi:hypothetical protein